MQEKASEWGANTTVSTGVPHASRSVCCRSALFVERCARRARLRPPTLWKDTMRSLTKAAAVIGPLAITGTLLLAGCGGSSTAVAPSATAASSLPSAAAEASTAPSAEASAEMPTADTAVSGSAGVWNPPRPSAGFTDEQWSDYLSYNDPTAQLNFLVESPPEDQARVCEQEKDFPPSPEEIVERADNAVYYFTDNDGTTAEEWVALLASQYETLAAIGYTDALAELCAALPPAP